MQPLRHGPATAAAATTIKNKIKINEIATTVKYERASSVYGALLLRTTATAAAARLLAI